MDIKEDMVDWLNYIYYIEIIIPIKRKRRKKYKWMKNENLWRLELAQGTSLFAFLKSLYRKSKGSLAVTSNGKSSSSTMFWNLVTFQLFWWVKGYFLKSTTALSHWSKTQRQNSWVFKLRAAFFISEGLIEGGGPP